MRLFKGFTVSMLAVGLIACQRTPAPEARTAVSVVPAKAARMDRQTVAEARIERLPIEVAPAAQGGSADDAGWMKNLRAVCGAIESPELRADRKTENSDTWQSKIDLKVKDLHLWSPMVGKWSLAKVDDSTKLSKVRARGPYFGYGMTVEVTNKSDQVLQGDNVYVWADFKSKTGKRTCFADANANRSWNPFAKKGKGAWVKEKEFSEWPLRPGETKRYTIVRTACFNALFLESEPQDIKIEVYARFRPLGGDTVITGPLKTFQRDGKLLRGLPMADSAQVVQINTKRGPVAARALFAAADHALVADGKKIRWIPYATLIGINPDNPPKTEALPATPADFTKTYGNLTLNITNWRVMGWRKYAGILKQGHKMLAADVEISIDTSSIQSSLEGAVNTAKAAATAATTEAATQEAGVAAAEAAIAAVAGTDGEAAAKAALKAAKADLKAAKKSLKAAEKSVKAAEKAMGGGVGKFLKAQAKAVNCGSFTINVGRKPVKLHKASSMNSKACKPLTGGQTVRGTARFDLQRWDLPFMISWKGPGKAMETHRIASESLAKILKD